MKVKLFAAALAVSVVSLTSLAAEPSTQLTRAQVRSELDALHRVGYSPQDWVHYPDNIQAAERKLNTQKHDSVQAAGN